MPNLVPLAILKKFQAFFSENPSIFFKKTNFWTFWEILLFQSHFTANLLPLAILKKFKLFFRKTHLFFCKKTNFWMFWKILLFQSHFTAKLLPLAILKKFKIFFRKSHLFFYKKNQFLNVLRTFTILVAFYGKFDCDLMKRIWHSNTWTTDVGSFTRAQLANIGLQKMHLFERKNLFSMLSIWRKIKRFFNVIAPTAYRLSFVQTIEK